MKYPTSLCEAMVVLSLYTNAQIRYTQYADSDIYADDGDDDAVEAGAYFFCSGTAMLTSTVNYIECQGQAFLYC